MINSLKRYPVDEDPTLLFNQSIYTPNFRISIQASSEHASIPKEDHETNHPFTHFEVYFEDNREEALKVSQLKPAYDHAYWWEQYFTNDSYDYVPRNLIETLLKFYLKDKQCQEENH